MINDSLCTPYTAHRSSCNWNSVLAGCWRYYLQIEITIQFCEWRRRKKVMQTPKTKYGLRMCSIQFIIVKVTLTRIGSDSNTYYYNRPNRIFEFIQFDFFCCCCFKDIFSRARFCLCYIGIVFLWNFISFDIKMCSCVQCSIDLFVQPITNN